tara:strand:+ start:49 stop:189 length:141 start_codon:yes stop_codon:yes gene_type:complete
MRIPKKKNSQTPSNNIKSSFKEYLLWMALELKTLLNHFAPEKWLTG